MTSAAGLAGVAPAMTLSTALPIVARRNPSKTKPFLIPEREQARAKRPPMRGNHRVPSHTCLVYRTLEYLRGISDDDVRRLRSRGIQHTNQLLHRTSLAIDRERLSKRTGISPERLLEFAHQCTLLEVSGMERQLPVIRRLGINSMKDLRAQDARALHAKLVDAIGLAGAPSISDVQYWISQATALDIVEEPEEKAPLASTS